MVVWPPSPALDSPLSRPGMLAFGPLFVLDGDSLAWAFIVIAPIAFLIAMRRLYNEPRHKLQRGHRHNLILDPRVCKGHKKGVKQERRK